MKVKTHNITGVFKNIPGKGIDEPAIAKKTWYSVSRATKSWVAFLVETGGANSVCGARRRI